MMLDIDILDIELRKTEAGSRLLKVFNAHVDEVFYLVSHHRLVKVAWQRNQGPAFVAGFLGTGDDPNATFNKEINGVSLQSLIRRMAAALQDAGSPALRKAIGEHTGMVLEWAQECNSINDVMNKLKTADALPAGSSFS